MQKDEHGMKTFQTHFHVPLTLQNKKILEDLNYMLEL